MGVTALGLLHVTFFGPQYVFLPGWELGRSCWVGREGGGVKELGAVGGKGGVIAKEGNEEGNEEMVWYSSRTHVMSID